MNNSIYLRRKNKVVVERGTQSLPDTYIAAFLKNIEALGYTFSEDLLTALRTLSLDELTAFYRATVETLAAMKGADYQFKPFYPNFPSQVQEMSEARLYINAILHYLTNRRLDYEKRERTPLLEDVELKVVETGAIEDFESIFTRLAGGSASLSAADKADLGWFVENYRDDVYRLLPEEIPQKENLAVIGALLAAHTTGAENFLRARVRTATDVLRLAVALSNGDVSLAEAAKFRSFKRSERRLLLELLENCGNVAEDMLRWKKRWIRLGERLHPGEFPKKYPHAFVGFDVVRNDRPFKTFNSRIESALLEKDAEKVVALLAARPGDFARRLDHLLRLDETKQVAILEKFAARAAEVSTPVLLQVKTHFEHRGAGRALRSFFPKGNVAKVQAIENRLPPLGDAVCSAAADICRRALVERFAKLPRLGKCYLDERLKDYLVPFSQRSASKALRTLVRGSRLPLPAANVIRFFLWWKNGDDRTDVDLSGVLYDENYGYQNVVAYYNLKDYGGCHSGDIVDAPDGAAEFIDIDIAKTIATGARYLLMSVNSYTEQPFRDLPECFAGWMARVEAESGEIFEPRTVEDRIDLAADTTIAIPLIVDLVDRRVFWTDVALKKWPSWNNVQQNLAGISLMLKALTTLTKTNLYDLFALHVEARGEAVNAPEEAETVFSVEKGVTPFDLDRIAAEFMI